MIWEKRNEYSMTNNDDSLQDTAADEFQQGFRYKVEELDAILSGMDEGVLFVDETDVIVQINPWLLKFTGLERKQIVKSHIKDFPIQAIRETAKSIIDAFKSGKDVPPSVVLRDIGEYKVQLRFQPIYLEEAYLGTLLNVVDVTSLVKARDKAEAANLAKSEFLANMSHEIRTPMSAVMGFAELLQTTELNEEQAQYVSIIQRGSKNLLSLINDILDFSKIEAGKMLIEKTEFELVPVMGEIESLLYPLATQKNIEFKIMYGKILPLKISTDRNRLYQCLLNIINNAIKFTETGHVHLIVRAEKKTDGIWVSFEVRDTGIGIPKERLEAIFDAFSQAEKSTCRQFGGSGLGLTITRKLIEMMGGAIEVSSLPGEGSVFRIVLPAGVESFGQKREICTPSKEERHKFDEVKYCGRVLVAEDNPANQILIQAILDRMDIQSRIASDGALAVKIATEEPFDLILMDIQMPNLNGYQATQILKKNGIKAPIIALTAHAMEGDRQKCIDAGCDDYLSKPVNKGKLSQLLGKYLKRQENPDLSAAQVDALCEETRQLADLCQEAADPQESAKTPTDKQS
jgi:signal transduction histidine kinase/DNA-binding NarL/FixJ family response regulator